MHICAHQITSWAVFQRAVPAAQGRDLTVKSSVQFLEVFFLKYFLFAQHDVVSKWQNTLF